MSQQARIVQLQLCLGGFLPDRPAVLEERNGEVEFRVVNNNGARESVVALTGLKCLSQKEFPKMPKDYEGGTLMLCSMLPRIR
ncbi:Histone acetyltransferase GCN5 [Metarhizium anisopliae]